MCWKAISRTAICGAATMINPTEKIFAELSEIEFLEPETVKNWGRTLIVAPHPDDESLGCGGAIALLRKFGFEVIVLTVSDGTLSHPNSQKYPPEKLRDLRENEMTAALEILGVAANKIKFLRLRDRSVPEENSNEFEAAVKIVKNFLTEHQPQTILVPWRRDPHPDHRASNQIINAAIAGKSGSFRLLEYPIWLWEMAENADLPREENIKIYGLKIDSVVAQKQAAIGAHVSQTTDLIDDDPNGFRLSPEVLAHFAKPFEIYLEEIK